MKRVKDVVKRLWPGRMRSQLILGIALVHIILMSLFVIDLVRKQRGLLKDQNRDQVRMLVSDLSANAGSFLLSNEYIGLEKLVEAYDTLPNLKYAMVVSNDGIVLAHSDHSKLGLRLNDSISLGIKDLSGIHVLVENNTLVDITAPVYNNFNKEIIGWARIGMSQEFITQNLISTSRKGGVYILLALIIGSLFAIYIASQLSRGLYKLIGASDKIKNGDRSARVGSFNIKELSELGNAFNQMVDEISAKETYMAMIIENMPVGVWLLDEKGSIVLGNTAGQKIWKGGRFVGINEFNVYKGWFTDTGKKLDATDWGGARSILKGETVDNEEIEIECFDGSHRFILNSSIPKWDNEGNIIGAIVINVDITEKKKTSQVLQEKENQLRLFIKHNPASLAMFDNDMSYIMASDKWVETSKLNGVDFIGKNHYELEPELPLRWKEVHQRCLKGVIEKCDEDSFMVDGRLTWLKWEVHPWRNDSNEIGGIIILTEEITAIKESELKFKNLVEKSVMGVYIIQNGKYAYANPRFAEIFGYTQEEITGIFLANTLIYIDDIPAVENIMKSRLEEEIDSIHYEVRGQRKDGSVIWVEVYGTQTLYNGEPAIIGTLNDISQRKINERMIIHEKNLSDNIINGLPGIFCISDQTGNLIRWNYNLKAVLGYSSPELQRMNFSLMIDENHQELMLDKRKEALLKGKSSGEINIVSKNGNYHVYYITVIPIIYNNKECLLNIGIDFTDKKEAEIALVKKNWEIKERVKELRCLYRLSELANGRKNSIPEILRECVNIIPPAYQYPDITAARIIFGNQDFKSEYFMESSWKQESCISINGERVGKVMVYYTKEMPEEQEGPFLTEERSLINSITEILGNAIERMLGESEILKLNRLYQFTSAINEMMLKADTNDFIYQQAAHIAIRHGKFKMAWIGNYDAVLSRVIPYSYAGDEKGYLKKFEISLKDDKLGNGPAGRAIRNKTYYYCNDIANDPNMLPWRYEALLRGYRSSISLPIIVNKEIAAVYTLYMSEPFFFNEVEIKMLNDVADNIAFALDKIRLKELQKQAENELMESEEKFRKLVEETLVGVFILQDEKFRYVNPCFERIVGYSKEELLNDITFEQLIHPDDFKKVQKNYQSGISGEKPSDHNFLKTINKEGKLLHIEIIVSFIQYKGRKAIIGTIIDVTEQVEEEKRINKAVNDAQENERQQISMELHDNVKQIMAASLLNLDVIRLNLNDRVTTIECVTTVKRFINDAISELRRISHRLAPSIDTSLDLEEKMRSLVGTMNISNKIDVSFAFPHFKNAIPNDIQLALYRILQEQFSNILNYAKATAIHIELKKQQSDLVMNIRDNGQGFDPQAKKSGIGLENIRRRANVLSGQMKIVSSPGKGCELVVRIPAG